MSEWLDVMVEEIARKQREAEEAKQELERRRLEEEPPTEDAQSK